MGTVDIQKVMDHYEVYIDGKFYCSCDSLREVDEELENYETKNN